MNYKLSFNKYHFLIAIFPLLLFSCKSKKTEIVNIEAKPEETEQISNIVSLTQLQMKTAGVELGQIEMKNLKNSIKANGKLKVPNHNKAFITSLYSGVIKTLQIQPGAFVNKGQTVATISNPDLAQLQQQLQTVNAQISLNEIELKRQQELVEGNAAPLKNVQRVNTELTTLKVTRNSLQKQLILIGISPTSVSKGNITTSLTITSPISGNVSNIFSQIGSEVNSTSPIAEVVNNSQLHLDLFIYEKDLPLLKKDQIIHFTLTNNPGKEYDAQIYSIGSSLANESKTVEIHAEVKGDKTGLIEGMNITALISIGESTLPAVPNEAIVSFMGKDYVFAQIKNSEGSNDIIFERLPVLKGATDVGFTEINFFKDVPADSKIVIKGAFFVMAKMTNVEED